ncbi:MAG TPA: hypothetical protein VFX98_15495 [Longimicrobiaceae bacterium]|nr:hypothetical protein [Longimicrobiaceae bacterium]
MASSLPVLATQSRFGETQRRDRWWVAPLATALTFGGAGGYATWAILQGRDYFTEPYLSPFYSPCLAAQCPDEVEMLGIGWWPFSPAILLMAVILGFRATCYYYRKAYYRSFFMDPPACAVGEPWGAGYRGETFFPLVLQNLHRYFLYLSIPVLLLLWYDTLKAFVFPGGFGVGLGTVVLLVNVVLLTGYLLGCHSLRHLVGGSVDCASCAAFGRARHGAWQRAGWFNRLHMQWAWSSLVFVCIADLYVRLLARGVISDPRIVF